MAITTVYRPCHLAIDLVLCLELKELPDLVVSQTFRYFQLLFFELTANCCQLFSFHVPWLWVAQITHCENMTPLSRPASLRHILFTQMSILLC